MFNAADKEDIFKDLVSEDYNLYVNTFHAIDETQDIDGLGAQAMTGFMPGFAFIMEGVIMIAPDNTIWTAILDVDNIKYYTNSTVYTDTLPKTIKKWAECFIDVDVAFMYEHKQFIKIDG